MKVDYEQRGYQPITCYQIKVQGELDESWEDWLYGFTIATERDADGVPTSCLTGIITDQAALRGILNKLWDLNLTLLSVKRLEECSAIW